MMADTAAVAAATDAEIEKEKELSQGIACSTQGDSSFLIELKNVACIRIEKMWNRRVFKKKAR